MRRSPEVIIITRENRYFPGRIVSEYEVSDNGEIIAEGFFIECDRGGPPIEIYRAGPFGKMSIPWDLTIKDILAEPKKQVGETK